MIGLLNASTALKALVGGNIYRNLIPQSVSLPAVRIDLIISRATRFSTGHRALTRATIQVAACTQGDDLQAGAAIWQAIDAALENQVCQVGTLVAKINQEMLIDTSNQVEGERFNLLGARYRVIFYQPDGTGD